MINSSCLRRMIVEKRVEMRAIPAAECKCFAAVCDHAIFASGPYVEFLDLIYVDDRRAVDAYEIARVEIRFHLIHRLA